MLGPSVGYNREVVLIRATEPGHRETWILPTIESDGPPEKAIGDYLSGTFGVVTQPQELRGRCDRWSTSRLEATTEHLCSIVLGSKRFDALLKSFEPLPHEPCGMQARSFRTIFHKSPDLDWGTLGMIMHVFEHLER